MAIASLVISILGGVAIFAPYLGPFSLFIALGGSYFGLRVFTKPPHGSRKSAKIIALCAIFVGLVSAALAVYILFICPEKFVEIEKFYSGLYVPTKK